MIYGLDLFSGIGGLTLALQEWVTPVAYCEIDKYAQSVLLSRMSEGKLPNAPIWDDIKTLKGKSLPKIDIIYGGFPCQDISVAGAGKGLEGQRSGLFYEIVRLAKEIKPQFIFLENVPAIRTRGLESVAKELASQGYDLRWDIVSAQEMGAPHRRERWFCLAYFNGDTIREQSRRLKGKDRKELSEIQNSDTWSERIQREPERQIQRIEDFSWCKDVRRVEDLQDRSDIPQPLVRGKSNGIPRRVDRTKCCGNAVVPIQAREAFKRLIGLTKKEE